MAKPRAWTQYQDDLLGFAWLLGIDPAHRYRKFFRAAERGEPRIGVITPDFEITDQIVQTIVLWRIMVDPNTFVAVCHETEEKGKTWIKNLREMVATSNEELFEEILFAVDNSAVCRKDFDGWNLCICSPDQLVNVDNPIAMHRERLRSVVIITDPLDLLCAERVETVAQMKPDLWICTNQRLMV